MVANDAATSWHGTLEDRFFAMPVSAVLHADTAIRNAGGTWPAGSNVTMPGILPFKTINRRRVVQLGAGAMAAALTGTASTFARQGGGGAYTFVVGGLDTRTVEEPENTDVLMVARVDLDAGVVRAMSIPRDLYVEIPGAGYDKITRAYDYGSKASAYDWEAGAQLCGQTVAHNFGLTIDGVALTRFRGFEAVIDAIGGVEVNNPYDVYDGEYPTYDYGYKEIFYPAGVQTLNGSQALEFVRTRHQDGDDGRVMRQHIVLEAVLRKLQSPGIVADIPALVDATRDAVLTTIPLDLQMSLIAGLPNINPDAVVFGNMTQYLWGDTVANGMWVYQGDWSVLPGFVQGFLAGA